MKKIVFTFLSLFITFISVSQIRNEGAVDPDLYRLNEVYTYINNLYMDSVPNKKISEAGIRAMLEELDPHSTYISAENVDRADEQINGSFVGVGIRFNILKDTLLVVDAIPNGPSEKVGIQAGDKIIEIEGESIAGVGLKNSDVRKKLLGEKDSKVNVKVLRGKEQTIDYVITRDKIPIESVAAAYMIDEEIGYIKITSYSRTTSKEVDDALKHLKRKGMKDLILDLQGNGGGLLMGAKQVVDQFLDDGQLIVYSEGRAQPKSVLVADKKGRFKTGRLVVLINELSASASEITSGAIQDWDRGLIVGRRSFGKGLVQRPIKLADGSEVRLTIARYYTPSGRWIQKPYDDLNAYRNDYMERYKHGEMMHRDSINLPDSLIYQTKIKKRDVYGGGGIMPDIFVPLDTSEYSTLYKDINRRGIINTFTITYVNKNRASLKKQYNDVYQFSKEFDLDEDFWDKFFDYAKKEDSTLVYIQEDFDISKKLLEVRLKAGIAQNMWGIEAFYILFNEEENEIFMKGYEVLRNGDYERLMNE